MPSTTVMKPGLPPLPEVIGPATAKATRSTKTIPPDIIDDARMIKKETFDPERHLQLEPPSRIYTMKEIGLEGQGISPVAASEPFPLFTPEAIKQIRAEIFSEPVFERLSICVEFCKGYDQSHGKSVC